MKKTIELTQSAYICGYAGAFLRDVNPDGTQRPNGWWDNWYEAAATDENGNEYTVYWQLQPDFDPATSDDESDACDWDNPCMIIDSKGHNVLNNVKLS